MLAWLSILAYKNKVGSCEVGRERWAKRVAQDGVRSAGWARHGGKSSMGTQGEAWAQRNPAGLSCGRSKMPVARQSQQVVKAHS